MSTQKCNQHVYVEHSLVGAVHLNNDVLALPYLLRIVRDTHISPL